MLWTFVRPLGRVVLPFVVAILVVVGLTGEIPGGFGSRESTGVVTEATRTGADSMLGPAIDVEALKESLPAGLFPVVVESLQSDESTKTYDIRQGRGDEWAYILNNPLHRINAQFGRQGPMIASTLPGSSRWGLRLIGYGRDGIANSLPATRPWGSSSRIEYAYPNGVTEWYVNGPLGLQQGFTVTNDPATEGSGPLKLRLGLVGGVVAEISKDGGSAEIRQANGGPSFTYSGLYAYDSNGTRLPASLQSMATGISIQVDDSMAVYPITVDPFIQRSNFDGLEERQRPAFFGGAVAMDGDTIAIAIRDNQITSTGGVIYVFSRTTAGWGTSETAVRLENPGRAKRDLFGISVAVGGDVIVVGAPSAETTDSTGVVYVYSKPTGGWSDDVVPVNLVAPAGDSGGWLGNSVAISGNTIVAGAPYHGGYDEGIGSAFVFTKGLSGWAETAPAAKITPFDGAAQDRFGYSVAINGNSIVVGSPGSDAIAVESGSAYVFARPGTNWVSTSNAVRLNPSAPQAGDFFGHSVAIGADTVVVGAPQTDQRYRPKYPVGNGFVSVFNRSGSYTATGSITFTAPDGRWKDGYGWVVAVDAGTMVVGSPFNTGEVLSDDDSTSVFDSGAAYVYEKPAIGWNSGAGSTKILPEEAESGDRFGSALAVVDDLMVVGAPSDDNRNGEDAGTAYLFSVSSLNQAGDPVLARLTAFDHPGDDQFGHSVSIGDDFLAVGAPGNDDDGLNAGSVYVFSKREKQWQGGTERSRFQLPAPVGNSPGDNFGQAVAIDDKTIVVGAPGADAAYIYVRGQFGWYADAPPITLTAPVASSPGDNFGQAVAIDDKTIVVGAPGDASAYVFARIGQGWNYRFPPIKLSADDASADSGFGQAVAIDGNRIIVGAPGAASVYVFLRTGRLWNSESPQIKLSADDASVDSGFGQAVSIDGDVIVVGAPDSGTGSVFGYVFADSSSQISDKQFKFESPGGAAGDSFGHAIDISDDVIVVGAPGSDAPAGVAEGDSTAVPAKPDAGLVYAFRRPQNGWASTSSANVLTPSEPDSNSAFGYAVAVSGNAMAAGMPFDMVGRGVDDIGPTSGSVRVYTWPGLRWVDTPTALKLRPPASTVERISRLVLSADGSTAALATAQQNESGERAQGVHIFTRRGAVWNATEPVWIPFPDADQYAGHILAISENGDTIAVGGIGIVPGYGSEIDESTLALGAVYVYTRPSAGWAPTVSGIKIPSPEGQFGDRFGESLAISGGTIVVGAPNDDHDEWVSSGAAYVFARPSGGWAASVQAQKLTAPAGEHWSQFGYAVSISGNTIVVGAPSEDNLNGYDAGAAYVFERGARGWGASTAPAKLVAPDATPRFAGFGHSVAISRGTIVVGAPGASRAWVADGAAYVFRRPNGGWNKPYVVDRLVAPSPRLYGHFGSSVAITRDAIVVGGNEGYGAPGENEVFIFPNPPAPKGIAATPVRVSDPDGSSHDGFGAQVSVGGDWIGILAPRGEDYGPRSGVAYLFRKQRAS